jgi:hypothetical protein
VLELAEEALDEIALAIDAAVDRAVHETLAGRGDVGPGAPGSYQIEQGIGVVAAVGDDVTAVQAGEEVGRRRQVMGLSCGQDEPDRQAVFIDGGVDLGAQSSTRTADGVIRAPFFPPAACW